MTLGKNGWVAGVVLAAWLPTSLGCGQSPPQSVNLAASLPEVSVEAANLARQFAQNLRSVSSASIAVVGAVAIVTSDGLLTSTFDFTDAPKTGNVHLSAQEFKAAIPASSLIPSGNARVAAFGFLGGLAVTIALSAARALAQYFIDHPGAPLDREAALQIILPAMASPIGRTLGLNFDRVDWGPIAGKLLDTNSRTFTDLAQSAMGLVDRIQIALRST